MRASWSVHKLCWSHTSLRVRGKLPVRAQHTDICSFGRASDLDGQRASAPAAGPAGVAQLCVHSTSACISHVGKRVCCFT